MAYREEDEALRARRLSLETEIDSLDHRAREVPYLELRKRELQRELAALTTPDAKTWSSRSPISWIVGASVVLSLVIAGAVAFVAHRQRLVDNEASVTTPPSDATSWMEPMPFPSSREMLPVDRQEALVLAPSAGISIDFVGPGPAPSSDTVAGLAPLAHWNPLRDASGSSASLLDSVGAPIALTRVSWKSGDGWFDVQPQNPDSEMFSGYIEQSGAPDMQGTVTVSISSVPDALIAGKYAVVVYSDKMGNPEDQVTRIAITAGDSHQAFYLRDSAGHDYPLRGGRRGYVVATAMRDERLATPVANCAVFENISAKDFVVRASTTARMAGNIGGYLRSPINGLQILPMTALGKIGIGPDHR